MGGFLSEARSWLSLQIILLNHFESHLVSSLQLIKWECLIMHPSTNTTTLIPK
jgi:hypothetical protein